MDSLYSTGNGDVQQNFYKCSLLTQTKTLGSRVHITHFYVLVQIFNLKIELFVYSLFVSMIIILYFLDCVLIFVMIKRTLLCCLLLTSTSILYYYYQLSTIIVVHDVERLSTICTMSVFCFTVDQMTRRRSRCGATGRESCEANEVRGSKGLLLGFWRWGASDLFRHEI